MTEYTVKLRVLHDKQQEVRDSPAKRKIIRAGRRGGKTTLAADIAIDAFLAGRRILYATPTGDQITRFWMEVNRALREPVENKVFIRNKSMHYIELAGTEQRIRAKTAWNADTLRGDYADLLILDEYQLMNEDTWEIVGAPMLLDNNGDLILIYTPPSLHSRSASKATDPQHAAKLYKKHANDTDGRWQCFHFTSYDNPRLSRTALNELTNDMSRLAIRMEIEAEDVDEAPGALWTRSILEAGRTNYPEYPKIPKIARMVVGVDPTGTSTGDECGILGAGRTGEEYFTFEDASLHGSPKQWATAAVRLYHKLKADVLVAEKNYGGEMVEAVIMEIDDTVNVKLVQATRGKAVRAEPISAIAEKGHDHHLGNFEALEDEMCLWTPGDTKSPNRLDAKVFAYTELKTGKLNWDGSGKLGHVDGYKPIGE